MTKTTKTDALSRRKLLGRIGVLAAASYTVPAFTTLSMAQAGSGASGGSSNSSDASEASEPSNSGPSTSGPSTTIPTPDEGPCGPANPGDATYDQCLIDNGLVD